MVVKFADTQKEKDQKRVHHVGSTNLWGGIGLNNLPPQYLTVIILFFKFKPPPPKLIQIFNFFFKKKKGLPSNGGGSLSQLSGLNALGVQQLLAASSQNSLANTQGKQKNKRPASSSFTKFIYFSSFFLAAALQSLANLQSQAGLGGMNGAANGQSPAASAVNDLNSSLAALANFNSQNIFGSLGKVN